jgi:hypothetical protein
LIKLLAEKLSEMTSVKNNHEYTYKQFLIRLIKILFKPMSEWKKIQNESGNIDKILTDYSLILIAICTLTKFLNIIFSSQEINFYLAMKHSVILFSYLFGGLYLSYFVVKYCMKQFYRFEDEKSAFKLVAYSATPLYIANFIWNLFPELLIINILSLYGFYIAYKGIRQLYGIKSKQSIYWGIFTILIVTGFPIIIGTLFLTFIPL